MFLIATLSSKESELEECKKSVSEQTVGTEQIVYEGYDNLTAHHKVYSLFNNVNNVHGNIKYLCKLDADMRFNDKLVLSDVINYFEGSPEIDHIILPVNDYFTGKHIIGVHFFRAGVRWKLSNEHMFVDPNPDFCRKTKVLFKWKNRVDHCFNPGSSQSFLFGVHRASKMLEALRINDYGQFISQLKILLYVSEEYRQKKMLMHRLAMQGVMAIAEGSISHHDYSHKIKHGVEEKLLVNTNFNVEEYERYLNTLQKKIPLRYLLKLQYRKFVHFVKLVIYGYI